MGNGQATMFAVVAASIEEVSDTRGASSSARASAPSQLGTLTPVSPDFAHRRCDTRNRKLTGVISALVQSAFE